MSFDLHLNDTQTQQYICMPYALFLAGVTVGFSRPIFSVSESDGLVQICAEVLSGHLGTDISLPLSTDTGRSSLTGTNLV